jgi:hypothetical protein
LQFSNRNPEWQGEKAMDTAQTNKNSPPEQEGHESGNEKHAGEKHKNHIVTVSVNEQPVKLLGHEATGHEIKTAAIEQGVQIQLKFVLEEKLPDGSRRIVENHEKVHLREDLRFTAREDMVTVSVNEQPVILHGHRATGAEIKAAAIAQHVQIQPNFVLQEELPNGTSRIVGDNDEVHLREHLRFTAIAPDDNS